LTATNTLNVEVENIEILWIYCQSVFEDEAQKVYDIEPHDSMNYYKFYFIERDHLSVNIESSQQLEDLKFLDTPRPVLVSVNSIDWDEGVGYNFTPTGGIALSEVPVGEIYVDLYFKSPEISKPKAIAVATPSLVSVNQEVSFNGMGSYDSDGKIVSWVWDFGDGNYSTGNQVEHSYNSIGNYIVIFTVVDDDGLLDTEYANVSVRSSDGRPKIAPPIPDQHNEEDCLAWSIDLSDHLADPKGVLSSVSWSITGGDPSLCILSFEGTIGQRGETSNVLWFTPGGARRWSYG